MFNAQMKLVFYVLFLFLSIPLFGQGDIKELDKIKSRYMQITDSLELPPFANNKLFFNRVGQELVDKSNALIKKNGESFVVNTAKYFRLEGYLMLNQASTDNSEAILQKALLDAEVLVNSDVYPIILSNASTSWEISKVDLLNNKIASVFLMLGLMAFTAEKYEQGIVYFKKIADNSLMNNKNRCRSIRYIIPISGKLIAKLPYDSKMPAYLVDAAQYLTWRLDAADYKELKEESENFFKISTQQFSTIFLTYWQYHYLNDLASYTGHNSKNNLDLANSAADMGYLLSEQTYKSDQTILELFQLAVDNKTNKNYLIIPYLLSKLSPPYSRKVSDSFDDAKLAIEIKNLGLKSVALLLNESASPGCNLLLKCSQYYHQFGDEKNANKLKKMARDCFRKEKEERKIHHPIQRMYLGFNPLILIHKNIGLQLDLRSDNRMHSLGFALIQKRLDYSAKVFNGVDVNWKGFRVNYALKFPGKHEQQFYQGFQLGLSSKSYMIGSGSIPVYVNGNTVNYNFKPTELQLDVMYVFGVQALGFIFGTDASVGVGLSYNQFNGGNDIWNKEGYKIQSNLLTQRKASALYPIIKGTWTVGFHLHKKGKYMPSE